GRCLLDMRNPVGAIDVLKKALQEKLPEEVEFEAQLALGLALQYTGAMKESYAPLARAVLLDPKHAKAQCGMARALQARNDHTGCARACQNDIKLNESDPRPYHLLGRSLMQLQQVENAIKALEAALQRKERDPECRVLYATALMMRGDIAASTDAYRQAIA